MKIENIVKSAPAARPKETRSAPTRAFSQGLANVISDEVKLTATAEKLSQLDDDFNSLDVSDRSKIESIRQAIAEGRFQIDEEAVAEGLVRETISNLGRRASQQDD